MKKWCPYELQCPKLYDNISFLTYISSEPKKMWCVEKNNVQ